MRHRGPQTLVPRFPALHASGRGSIESDSAVAIEEHHLKSNILEEKEGCKGASAQKLASMPMVAHDELGSGRSLYLEYVGMQKSARKSRILHERCDSVADTEVMGMAKVYVSKGIDLFSHCKRLKWHDR